jgi:hypothetical protein
VGSERGLLGPPISFRLPEGWQAVSPGQLGEPDLDFAAIHLGTHGSGFTANITLNGDLLPNPADLPVRADLAMHLLREQGAGVALARRTGHGDPGVPALSQDLLVTTRSGERTLKLAMSQFYLAAPNAAGRPAMICAALTSTQAQLPTVIEDFREFLSTIELDDRT